MVPKGKIMIIGGAEEKDGKPAAEKENVTEHFEILKSLLPKRQKNHRIEVITSASSAPDDLEETYCTTFKEIGFSNFGFIHLKDRMEARESKYSDRVQQADVIFFTGGDQLTLVTVLAGTEILESIKDKYQRESDFLIAGTSAGAMALSTIMIANSGVTEALIGSSLQTSSGLGFLNNCIVDTHFIKRGRFSRLAHAVMLNSGNIGIGLGEDAALLIHRGNRAKCIGSGMVVIIDGSDIEHTNISKVEEGEPVYVENLKTHLLVENCIINMKERTLEFPKE